MSWKIPPFCLSFLLLEGSYLFLLKDSRGKLPFLLSLILFSLMGPPHPKNSSKPMVRQMDQLNSVGYKERCTEIDMGNELVVKWNRGRQSWEGVSNQRMPYIDVQNCPRTNLIIKISDNLEHIVLFSTQESHWACFSQERRRKSSLQV